MKETKFRRILVTNRGEIASRIIRAIREMDLYALVVYADNDRELPFVNEADEAYSLGSGELSQTYLNVDKILTIARKVQADAIHPGYGFLSENENFARACEASGIHFIGPGAEVISLMGNKSRARETASKLGVPVLEGISGDLKALVEMRSVLPYPVLIKPAAGGGGKGMRIVHTAGSFAREAEDASREALNYFGSEELYVERFLENPRHLEVQVIADTHGNSVHLFERECSLQRRYQKIIEEAPSGFISDKTRMRLSDAALKLVNGISYTNAGTIEFLLDQNQDFYFMEMNTRIQVEHPVTELITGVDLVKEQISIAQGNRLSFKQSELSMDGHAIEARLYAEDPLNNFLPSSGLLETYDLPGDQNARTDTGYRTGNRVEPWYDPMLAKIIVKGKDREDACKKMIRALHETHVTGLSTNRDFLVALLRSGYFTENRIHTRLLDLESKKIIAFLEGQGRGQEQDLLLAAAAFISLFHAKGQTAGEGGAISPWQQIGHWRILPGIMLLRDQERHFLKYRHLNGKDGICFQIDGQEYEVRLENRKGNTFGFRINEQYIKAWGKVNRSEIYLDLEGRQFTFRRPDIPDRRYVPASDGQAGHKHGEIAAPLNGRVARIHVKEGDRVEQGSDLVVIESMKMENKILSDRDAVVEQIGVSVGQQVQTNQILLRLANI